MDHLPTELSPSPVDDQGPEVLPYPALSAAFRSVRDGAVRSAPEKDLHPIPSVQELLTAVLTLFHARSASPTATTCPPRANAGPDKEL